MKLIRGHFSRKRNLQTFNKRFSRNSLQEELLATQNKNKKVRVLEIGCGEGRVMMELLKEFPNVEFHGVNKKPWRAMIGQKSLRRTGTYYKIFTKGEIDKLKLPKIHFLDAGDGLPFDDNYFDVIYSQVSFHYIKRKDKALEAIWRVLKKNAIALIHSDTYVPYYPDFLPSPTPRFIVYKDGKQVSLKKVLEKKGYDVTCQMEITGKHVRSNIVLRKNTNKTYKLGLHFDEKSSFALYKLETEENKNVMWGYRSVFSLT